jgi:Glycosyl transferase family 2
MRCPSLNELPPPPQGKTGWPWTEESSLYNGSKTESGSVPRVTIVTPSYNQGSFIEETIRSILLQGYPDLEYFIIDGGSTDNTLEIIKKYSPWITFWISEPDNGQSAAINRGLRMGSGTYATWINSDDLLCRDALRNHFSSHGIAVNVFFVGYCVHISEGGEILSTHRGRVESLEGLVRIDKVWCRGGCIDQPAVLFPLKLAVDVGGLNERNHYTMDYELWGQFLLAGAAVHYTNVRFGMFRWQKKQKTRDRLEQTESMLDVAAHLVSISRSLSEKADEILADLTIYRKAYPQLLWEDSGRLARIGLPRSLVSAIRGVTRLVKKSFRASFVSSYEE